MSGFFIFEIKHSKINKTFYFLKDHFSVMSGPIDTILGALSETNVRLIKIHFRNFCKNKSNVITYQISKDA